MGEIRMVRTKTARERVTSSLPRLLGALVLALVSTATGAGLSPRGGGSESKPQPAASATDVTIFDRIAIHWREEDPAIVAADGFVIRHHGQTIERTLDLPTAPADAARARRIVVVAAVEPVPCEGKRRPNDLWNRLGSVTVLAPKPDDGSTQEIELVRFVTGYGTEGVFEADVTPLAPLLHGRQTIRAMISSYSEAPGWRISVTLRYDDEGAGIRRPIWTAPLFNEPHVTAEAPRLTTSITVPAGTDVPRVRVLTTGHATDGLGANEFVTSTHVLRVDGREVARWRPWAEAGGPLRGSNLWSGRRTVDGREVWSSDYDRSGWHPGQAVEPLVIPVPELTAGRHTVEIEILDIRPKDVSTTKGERPHGYWIVSAAAVADEPWPEE